MPVHPKAMLPGTYLSWGQNLCNRRNPLVRVSLVHEPRTMLIFCPYPLIFHNPIYALSFHVQQRLFFMTLVLITSEQTGICLAVQRSWNLAAALRLPASLRIACRAALRTSSRVVSVMALNDACLRKIEYGAMLGGAVGATFGALFGGYEASRYRSVSVAQRVGLAARATLGGAAVFGCFLAVGTAIRGCGGPDRF